MTAYLPCSYLQKHHAALLVTWVFVFYSYAVIFYRIFLLAFPLREGDIKTGSQQEFVYHVYLLFYLILFYQLIRPKILPVPLLKLVYLALGAKLGKNTFCSGTILDPVFTRAGDNTIIGEDSCLFAHAIEGIKLSHKKIVLGNNVTIGAKSILMAGVVVKDNSIVAAGSVVPKNTVIEENQVWAGNPAVFIKTVTPDSLKNA